MKPKETPVVTVAHSLALTSMVSQIGCVTVVIVLGGLLAGLWLDTQFGTKPVLTIVMLLLSIPVSMYSLIRIALSTVAQFQAMNKQSEMTDDQPVSTVDD
jgi:F0F1-type ATP synthase assembly protein I